MPAKNLRAGVLLGIVVCAAGCRPSSSQEGQPSAQVDSFEQCVAAGYPAIDSFPERCETPDGTELVADLPAGWKSSTDTTQGVSFSYPSDLGTTYIHAVDWPPRFAVDAGPF